MAEARETDLSAPRCDGTADARSAEDVVQVSHRSRIVFIDSWTSSAGRFFGDGAVSEALQKSLDRASLQVHHIGINPFVSEVSFDGEVRKLPHHYVTSTGRPTDETAPFLSSVGAVNEALASILHDLQLTGSDMVHTHSELSAGAIIAGKHKSGFSVLYTMHIYNRIQLPLLGTNPILSPFLIGLQEELMRESDAVAAPTDIPARGYSFVRIIGNPTTLPRLVAASIRQPITLNLLAVGRLSAGKNLRVLLEALRGLSVPYHLTIAGQGPERQRLEQYAKESRLDVTFLGHVSRADLFTDVYARNDVLVAPSMTETYNLVLDEAMAAGLLCVVPPLDAYKGRVQTQKTGLLYDTSAKGLTEVLKWAADHPEEVRRIRSNAQQHVQAFHRHRIDRYHEVYSELLRRRTEP